MCSVFIGIGIRYIAMSIALAASLLYIAEAIYIDVLLYAADKDDENITLRCGRTVIDYKEAGWYVNSNYNGLLNV